MLFPPGPRLHGFPRAGLHAGLRHAGLRHAGLPHAGLPHAGPPHAGLPRAGLPATCVFLGWEVGGGKIISFVSVPKETPFPQIPTITQKPAFFGNL